MSTDEIRPQFVDFIPQRLEVGVLYISERYKTASHLCPCGCGEKVVTPLSPVDWTLRNSAGVVSLHPSIGNWNYSCRSHYWIRRNHVVWAGSMTEEEIALVQVQDLADKAEYIERVNMQKDLTANGPKQTTMPSDNEARPWFVRIWRAFKQWLVR